MARSFSTQLVVFRNEESRNVGVFSRYLSEAHLATGKTIKGWQWGKRRWASKKEIEGNRGVGIIWDPTKILLPDDFFQSGHGDLDDILLKSIQRVSRDAQTKWLPEVNHGFFFSQQDSWYLFGDGYVTDVFETANVVGGQQVLQLSHTPKPTLPILVRQFEFDSETGRHSVFRQFNAVTTFGTPVTEPEYTIVYSPQATITLDSVYHQEIGTAPVINAGVLDLTSVQGHEKLGQSLGLPGATYFSRFSPFDTTEPYEVISYLSSTDYIEWTILPLHTDFSDPAQPEVQIDTDLGIIKFGEYVPPVGSFIMLRYTPGVCVQYEPEHTTDTVIADRANMYPLAVSSDQGFVEISPVVQIPGSIELTMEDVSGSGNNYDVSMGNSYAKAVARVYDKEGAVIEGIQVTFELIGTKAGSFSNGADSVTSSTDGAGRARTFYRAPISVDDLAIATDSLSIGGGETVLTLQGLSVTNLSEVTLYQIVSGDLNVGASSAEISSEYTTFFTTEGISDGVTDNETWESNHRLFKNLLRPMSMGAELIDGRKQLVITQSPPSGLVSIDPHTGNVDNAKNVPLIPTAAVDVSIGGVPSAQLTYPTELTPIGGIFNSSDGGSFTTKAYAVVGKNNVQMRAYVVSPYTNNIIYSNTINVTISVPDTMNGTYITDVLNSITLTAVADISSLPDATINPTSSILGGKYNTLYNEDKLTGESYADWFRRSLRGDTVSLQEIATEMNNITPGSGDPFDMQFVPLNNGGNTSLIPLGFRLKSNQVFLSSILNTVVYYEVNDHLPPGYWT